MPKRDYFEEIQALRSRSVRRKGPFAETLKRMDPLGRCTRELAHRVRLNVMQREFLRYAPVGAVACLEGYYKGLIRDLVDFGSPFRDNVANLKEVRLTLEGLVGLHTGKASLGEFVTHFIAINSLEDIDRAMSAITGVDFLNELKRETGINEKTLAGVARTFELRHIIVHELAPDIRPSPTEADECVMWSFFLILASENYWHERLIKHAKPQSSARGS